MVASVASTTLSGAKEMIRSALAVTPSSDRAPAFCAATN
jgi:hypothetical protein